MIPFNVPAVTGKEKEYILDTIDKKKLSGDGPYSKKCHAWLENHLNAPKALLTTSCTDALEMAAILLGIENGDEVIMPSYTFVSSANAFAVRGAKIVFVDINPKTMNIDEKKIAEAITNRTKAILVVHYGGWSADMDLVMAISKQYNIPVVEDAAQALGSTFNNKPLGSFGAISCFSFHETKNVNCGEGGVIIINDPALVQRSEIIRDKGTNRSLFLRGQVDKYTWVDLGSSFLPSELNAAFLYAQLESFSMITERRLQLWNNYKLQLESTFEILKPSERCEHNAHLFAIKLKDIEERTDFISFLGSKNILAVFHYVPLHSSVGGKKFGRMHGEDVFTTKESNRLVRLPLYFSMTDTQQVTVINAVKSFKRHS